MGDCRFMLLGEGGAEVQREREITPGRPEGADSAGCWEDVTDGWDSPARGRQTGPGIALADRVVPHPPISIMPAPARPIRRKPRREARSLISAPSAS